MYNTISARLRLRPHVCVCVFRVARHELAMSPRYVSMCMYPHTHDTTPQRIHNSISNQQQTHTHQLTHTARRIGVVGDVVTQRRRSAATPPTHALPHWRWRATARRVIQTECGCVCIYMRWPCCRCTAHTHTHDVHIAAHIHSTGTAHGAITIEYKYARESFDRSARELGVGFKRERQLG